MSFWKIVLLNETALRVHQEDKLSVDSHFSLNLEVSHNHSSPFFKHSLNQSNELHKKRRQFLLVKYCSSDDVWFTCSGKQIVETI